ncbi:hypothetical protein ACNHUS_30440 [Actinomycetes bacterium M1A6_2h]
MRTVTTALSATDSSVRLRAALDAGIDPDPALVGALVERCGLEPDFFVRDMLTWALTRFPPGTTVPLLVAELRSERVPDAGELSTRRPWTVGRASCGSWS